MRSLCRPLGRSSIVDAYLDEQVFNLYVDKVSASATVRILSNKIGANVETVAKIWLRRRNAGLSNCDPAQTCMTARSSLINEAGSLGSR